MSENRYLVTGAGGFIGSNIVRRLLAENKTVIGIDNFSTGRRCNLDDIIDKFEFIEGDLADTDTASSAVSKATHILHQAAIPSVQRSLKDPFATNRSCIDATLNVLDSAVKSGIKRVVVAASSSAYGDTPTLPKEESMPTKPLSPYAVAKLSQENYARAFSTCFGLETISLRYFNVFGPHQDPESDYAAVIPKFIRLILQGKTPVINGDGSQSRDFTFIENVISANVLAATTDNKLSGEVVNIACGKRIDLNELVKKLNNILGTDITPEYGPSAKGDVKHSLADISKAAELIGYEPIVNLDDGLKKTAEWVKANL
ncbi:MAG: SDR family oxidoreductase [Planctomycetota bacterium]|jgi:nucleoside-diphosphate-sugar epimerase